MLWAADHLLAATSSWIYKPAAKTNTQDPYKALHLIKKLTVLHTAKTGAGEAPSVSCCRPTPNASPLWGEAFPMDSPHNRSSPKLSADVWHQGFWSILSQGHHHHHHHHQFFTSHFSGSYFTSLQTMASNYGSYTLSDAAPNPGRIFDPLLAEPFLIHRRVPSNSRLEVVPLSYVELGEFLFS